MSWRPRRLRTQLILLIVVVLVLAQAVSLWTLIGERNLAVRAALGFEAVGRAANIVRLLEEVPEDLHPAILRAADSPLVRFSMTPRPSVDHTAHDDERGLVEARLRSLLDGEPGREIRVELHEVEGRILPLPNLSPDMAEIHRKMMQGAHSTIELNLSIALKNGQWLNVGTRFSRPALQWPLVSVLSFGMTAGLLLIAVSWFLLTRLIGPLHRLSMVADGFGRGEETLPLPVTGPHELRELTEAFNRMQGRLSRLIADRTRVLSALGHDLRSPLTAMRVRVELVEEEGTRETLTADIEEMQEMVDATLAFARGISETEQPETMAVGEFLLHLRKDMLDAFEIDAGEEIHFRVRPRSLRRALRNVIENALRYGGSARVSWSADATSVHIHIEDDGPGIPESAMDEVFEPFFRIEKSRSRDTGGHGLGLSITRTILRGQGGDVTLKNRARGGLSVTITVPRDPEKDERR
ncbi:HAMP domain-containing protein [Salinihabitans flavidus]|uniref:histidine kinase n=1 Tax=Salinihabitans flavidus TaxID=569882 RepID=A0A1H8VSD4_9RHOB|nr:ATP-binding protein [Salinihabitans flavidus]SEP18339.1 HAMP domain-containing protein [Salinihabitans flavidus]